MDTRSQTLVVQEQLVLISAILLELRLKRPAPDAPRLRERGDGGWQPKAEADDLDLSSAALDRRGIRFLENAITRVWG